MLMYAVLTSLAIYAVLYIIAIFLPQSITFNDHVRVPLALVGSSVAVLSTPTQYPVIVALAATGLVVLWNFLVTALMIGADVGLIRIHDHRRTR